MAINKTSILILNGGSSSIKFAVHSAAPPFKKLLYGKIDRIGATKPQLVFSRAGKNNKATGNALLARRQSPVNFLFQWLKQQKEFKTIKAVGHRLVYATTDTSAKIITQSLLKELRKAGKLSPNHLPAETALIETAKKYFAGAPQVACFDSDFHKTMPPVSRLLPIPRRYMALGVRRYGYHGISCAYVMQQMALIDKQAAKGRLVIAHLGNGCSITAVNHGKSMDTSMGFTPTGGLPMGSRTGDIDPGVLLYLMEKENLTHKQLNQLVNRHSGLRGISETSSDIRDLLDAGKEDIRAAEAIELFCYQVRKAIGACAAALNGMDTLVFTGGIGEHQPAIRQRICSGLTYLGTKIDEKKNKAGKALISGTGSKVNVRIVKTDEEWMMAKIVHTTLAL